jgi:hypothetical protein
MKWAHTSLSRSGRSGGALTGVGYETSGRGGRVGRPVDEDAALDSLRTLFEVYAKRRTGAFRLVLRRQESGWAVDYAADAHALRPLEAKTLPVRGAGTSELQPEGLGRLLRAVSVPAGGSARLMVEARLEDGRVEGWELKGFQVTRQGTEGGARVAAESVHDEAAKVLLPFLQGLGPRVVRLDLTLVHRGAEARAGGWVERAQVVRVSQPAGLDADEVAEYRAMHEDILRRWREGVHEGFTWLTQRGVEELALWYVGGVLAKGAGFLAARGGGIVLKALRRGKEAAAGWLCTMLTRLSDGEKRAFERLWAKVQLEGEKALSAGERQELRVLMARIDNAPGRLAVVQDFVHARVGAVWTKFRRAHKNATPDEVETAARIIDSHFESWYHRVNVPGSEQALVERAEHAALKALRSRFSDLD